MLADIGVKKVMALSADKHRSYKLYGATKLSQSDKLFTAANDIVGNKKAHGVVRYGNVISAQL